MSGAWQGFQVGIAIIYGLCTKEFSFSDGYKIWHRVSQDLAVFVSKMDLRIRKKMTELPLHYRYDLHGCTCMWEKSLFCLPESPEISSL